MGISATVRSQSYAFQSLGRQGTRYISDAVPQPAANFSQAATTSFDYYTPGESPRNFVSFTQQQVDLATSNGPSKVEVALTDYRLRSILSTFRPELQEQLRNLSDAQIRVLKGGMTGTTQVGPVTVDNRKAFVKGSVAFKSIWGSVHQSISDARKKYSMLTGPEEKGLHTLVDSVSKLEPEQRRQLADLMDKIP